MDNRILVFGWIVSVVFFILGWSIGARIGKIDTLVDRVLKDESSTVVSIVVIFFSQFLMWIFFETLRRLLGILR